jgi:hypothetical protein
MLALSAYAQTSNVETVKAWTRDPVMADLQTGELRDTSGLIADGQRMAATESGLNACTNLVIAANAGLSNALARLYAETNRVSAFEGRVYIAADMDVDEGNSNIWFTTGREWLDPDLAVHYWVNCSHTLSVFPETLWDFETAQGEVVYATGEAQNSGQPVTNINGIAYYHVKVPRPQGVGNVVIRTNKHLKMGHSTKPLNLAPAGMTLNGAALYTGIISETNNNRVVTRTYSHGALTSRTETTTGE